MSKRFLSGSAMALLALCLIPGSVLAQDEAAAERSDAEKIGYFLGLSVGQQMSQNGFQAGDLDTDALMAGFQDGLAKKDATMSDEQLQATQQLIQKLLDGRLRAKGNEFLAENAKKEGIKTLEQGLQYKVLTAGDGESPAATDTVKVHYTGKLIDGTVFDSSVRRGEPATFRVNQVIEGWQMALQKMKVGSKWMLYIPSDLAYGERGSPGAIGPHEVLIFEVELLEIQ